MSAATVEGVEGQGRRGHGQEINNGAIPRVRQQILQPLVSPFFTSVPVSMVIKSIFLIPP